MHPMLNTAIQAARDAGKLITRHMDRIDTLEVTEKSKNDLVTSVDKAAEAIIVEALQKAYPSHAIIAEEGSTLAGKEDNDFCWLIDPLDGTTNYVHQFPHYAVSIALKQKNEVVVGVVYDPIRQELFTAAHGDGAYLNNRRIRVSGCKKLENALIGTGFPFRDQHHLKPYLNIFTNLFPQTAGVRRAGAASLDLAYIAAGRLDGFWEASLKDWDMAAGTLLIKEAGGFISDFHGDQTFLDTGNVIAGSPKIHKAILDIVTAALEE